MIITRAPLRISLLGGGTDLTQFYKKQPSYIFGGSIDKYVYVISNNLSKFSTERFRFTYRVTESVKNYKDFQHPVVRECFELFPKIKSLNLTTFSDIPGGTGLGSSSSFTVALLGNLMERSNSRISPRILSAQAIHLERNVLNESGGVQDQLHASYGGLRFYKLSSIGLNQGKNLSDSTIFHELNKSILLVRVGGFRKSKEMHGIEKLNRNQILYLEKIQQIASYFKKKFDSQDSNFSLLTECINESWELKKRMSDHISNDEVEEVINKGMRYGASAAKLCGAGTSGFVLFLANQTHLKKIESKFKADKIEYVKFINSGFETMTLMEGQNNWNAHQ
jgi:D-glycero-alpha-D-manno-heptose-7-phosphate kinase